MAVTSRQVEISPLLRKAGIDCDHLEILESVGMYPYKTTIEENWAYFTALGFRALDRRFKAEGQSAEYIGIVGIGSGVEGIAAASVFNPALKELCISDIDQEILDGACANLRGLSDPYGIRLTPLVGSFCEPFTQRNEPALDLVHANIPNLPASAEMDLSGGAEKGTFLPSNLYEKYQPPSKYLRWALGPQWAYLRSAMEVVRIGGSILTELGGRIPISLIEELFADLDLEFSEVLVGFKEQTEALIDFQGYQAFENNFGVTFDFYLHQPSLKTLEENGLEMPTSELRAQEFKTLLEPHKVSSGDALRLHRQGIAVGHTVHIFRGVRKR